MKLGLRTLLAAITFSVATPALAQGPERPLSQQETQAVFEAGVKLYKAGDNAGALAKFERAWVEGRLLKALFNLARCEQLVGRHADAENHLREYLRSPAATPESIKVGGEMLRELGPSVAHVTVDASVDALAVDGRKAPLESLRDPVAISPGMHAFELRQGEKVDRWSAELKAGDTLKLPRPPEPTAPAPPQKITPLPVEKPAQTKLVEPPSSSSWTPSKIAIVSGLSVVAATSLALSAGFFVGASSRADELARLPRTTTSCSGASASSADCALLRSTSDARVSDINVGRAMLGAGIGLGLGALATAIFWDPRPAPSRATLQPLLSPTTAGIGVAGHF